MPQWTRSEGIWRSRHFRAAEFNCPCGVCQMQIIGEYFLEKLDTLRDQVGLPIKVNNGYRCQKYQDDLTKRGYETAKGISSHTQGIAADITCSDMQLLEREARKIFKNIGVGSTFLHVDDRSGGPREWRYKT